MRVRSPPPGLMELDKNLFNTIYVPWMMVVEGLSYKRSIELCDALFEEHRGHQVPTTDDLRVWVNEHRHHIFTDHLVAQIE